MPIKIHGKTYYTVAERMQNLKEAVDSYSLTTEIISVQADDIIVKATLTINGNTYTGHALENRSDGMINRKSHLENAETSSIGRALAAAGFSGSDGEYCSLNEIENKAPKLLEKIEVQSSPPTEEFKIEETTTGPSDSLPCPKCKNGKIEEKPKTIGCSAWRDGCSFSFWRNDSDLNLDDVRQILSGKESRIFTMKKKDGNTYRAKYYISDDIEPRLDFNCDKLEVENVN